MKNPQLKEYLLDAYGSPEELELEQRIIKWQLDPLEESPEEKAIRLSVHDRIDRANIIAHAVIVAICGPYVVYQRMKLIRMKPIREAISTLWKDSRLLNHTNDGIEADIASMKKDIERLESCVTQYESLMKGYDRSGVRDLFHENKQIIKEKKQLAEAIGLQKLIKSILITDANRDHRVGDAELSILTQRIQLIEGVPFTSEEVCERFGMLESKSLRNLAEVVQTLFIEMRREQIAVKMAEESEKSPKSLGAPFLWKEKLKLSSVGDIL
ncbi:hypothetical protein ACHAWF_004061 [Thalassiosira exigua]